MLISRRTLIGTAVTAALCSRAHAFTSPRFRWEEFCQASLSPSGRVIDASDSRMITTSEGQSYALFFALVAADRTAFGKILDWTENNLCGGDIARRLPAWLWGRTAGTGKSPETWGVLDANNATDADMWIAYSLLEAGRLWNRPELTDKGRAILEQLKALVRPVPQLGRLLLPAAQGFEKNGPVTVFNPSYLPTLLLRRFAREDPFWSPVASAANRLLVRTASNGFAPDWAEFDGHGLHVIRDKDVGSYDAIRVYLWLGMLSRQDPARELLVRQFYPMVRVTQEQGYPPEKVNMATLKFSGRPSVGFSACMLQLLTDVKCADYIRMQMHSARMQADTYYQNCLIMFAQGFDDGAFSFDANGALKLHS